MTTRWPTKSWRRINEKKKSALSETIKQSKNERIKIKRITCFFKRLSHAQDRCADILFFESQFVFYKCYLWFNKASVLNELSESFCYASFHKFSSFFSFFLSLNPCVIIVSFSVPTESHHWLWLRILLMVMAWVRKILVNIPFCSKSSPDSSRHVIMSLKFWDTFKILTDDDNVAWT